MSYHTESVIVVALDGATFRILDPLCEAGIMPNLKRITRKGVRSILQSTVPPITAPAWATFYTGNNPGKHGLYSFFRRGERGGIKLANSQDIHGIKIWDILNNQDKQVGLLNLELIYPLPRIEGWAVPLFGGSRAKEVPVHPPELATKLERAFGHTTDLMPAGADLKGKPEEVISAIEEVTRFRVKQYTYLLENHPTDFSICLFKAPDILQHRYYGYLDPKAPEFDTHKGQQIRDLIHPIFSDIDKILGKISKIAGESTTLIIMSDHGFSSIKGRIYGNQILRQIGFQESNSFKYALMTLFQSWLPRFHPRFKGIHLRTMGLLHQNILDSCISKPKTRARFGSASEQGIFLIEDNINSKHRELALSKLSRAFSSLKHPLTGEKVCEVYRREELFNGPYVKSFPHLILDPKSGYICTDDIVQISKRRPWAIFENDPLVTDSSASGYHDREGIFIGYGPALKEGKKMNDSIEIADLFPLICWLTNCSIPTDIDGNFPESIIKQNILSHNPPRYKPIGDFSNKDEVHEVYDEEEEKEILERLSDLGYL